MARTLVSRGSQSHETLQLLTLFGDLEEPEYTLSFPSDISSFHYHNSIFPMYFFLKTRLNVSLLNYTFDFPLIDRKLRFENTLPYSCGFSMIRLNYSQGEPWDSLTRDEKFPTPIWVSLSSTSPAESETGETEKTISSAYAREVIPIELIRRIETDISYRIILWDLALHKLVAMRPPQKTQLSSTSLSNLFSLLFQGKTINYLENSESTLELSNVILGNQTYLDTIVEYLPMFFSDEPILVFYNQDLDRVQVGSLSSVYSWAAETKGERILSISGRKAKADFNPETLEERKDNVFSPDISDGIVSMLWFTLPAYSSSAHQDFMLNTEKDEIISSTKYRTSNISPILDDAELRDEALWVTERENFLSANDPSDLIEYELWLLDQVSSKGIIKARVNAVDPLVYHPPSAVIVAQQNQQIAWKSLVFSLDVLAGKSAAGGSPAVLLELGIIPIERIEV